MPSSPEIRGIKSLVRRIEILRKADAEHMRKADGHVAVSREIEINLIGVAESAQPGASCAECRERSQPGIDYGSDSIGDEDFLNKADNEVGPADVETAAAICQIKMLESSSTWRKRTIGPAI